MGRPRVLMLSDQLGHAGGRVHGLTTYFATHLPALSRAADIELVFLSSRHPAAEILEAEGVRPTFLGRSKWDVRSATDVVDLIRRRSPDVLHLHGEKSLLLGGMLGSIRGIPTVFHLHDAIALRPPLRTIERRVSRGVTLALVISEEIRRHATDEYGFLPERVRVLSHGIDLARFGQTSAEERARIRREIGVPETAPLVGVLGRINRDKGQLEAIAAMAKIVAARPDATLAIVGEGPGRAECEARAAALGLESHVVFTGQRADAAAVLGALDILLVPSMWQEAFGFVALEGIASRLPVIAFESGGIRNTVLHDRTGIVVSRGDVDGLAKETLALLGDPERRARYGEAGRAHAERFTVARHVASLVEIYDGLSGTTKAGAPTDSVRSSATSF